MPSPSLSPPEPPSPSSPASTEHRLTTYLLAGGIAGLSVDLVLYPIDTIKTRMQSAAGLWKSGGFRNLYAGLTSVAVGSAPGSALFFLTYEYSKKRLSAAFNDNNDVAVSPTAAALTHCMSAGFGESVACIVRVPTENIKQKMQARPDIYKSAVITAQHVYHRGGIGLRGFYVGYVSTLMRELPFAFIQFPIYEYVKRQYAINKSRACSPVECAFFGSIAGAVAAAATTPMDTIKTRMMTDTAIAYDGSVAVAPTMLGTLRSVYREGGVRRLFSGIIPRVIWIGVGGGVFFGAYEASTKAISHAREIPITNRLR